MVAPAPFCGGGNKGSGKLSNLPKVVQLRSSQKSTWLFLRTLLTPHFEKVL